MEIPADGEISIDSQGQPRSTMALDFKVEDKGGTVATFRRELVEFESGKIVQVVHPLSYSTSSKIASETHMGIPHLPPAFGWSLLWGKTWEPGSEIIAAYPPTLLFPTNESNIRWNALRLVVADANHEDGVCTATIRGTLEGPVVGSGPKSLTLEMRIGSSAPVPLEVKVLNEGPEAIYQLRLTSTQVGLGTPLPRFFPVEKPVNLDLTGLAVSPLVNGFLAGNASTFATSFSQAFESVRNDTHAKEWLANHPGAAFSSVAHSKGKPNGTVVDSWFLKWYDLDSGEGSQAYIERRRPYPFPLNEMTEVRVRFDLVSNVRKPSAVATGPSLEDFEILARRLHHEPLESLTCFFNDGFCMFGSHESTGDPYAGESGFSSGGILVWISNGMVLQSTKVS